MINQLEVAMYLEETLPDISSDLKKSKFPANVYKVVHVFLDYTFRKIKEHNLAAVKECFLLAEKLYSKGNMNVKCAVENVFVFSFSHIPESNPEEKKKIMGLIPGALYSIYVRQLLNSRI